MHPDLCGLKIKNFVEEREGKEYSAASFEISNQRIIFRAGKITPTKIGQFVTLWKRVGQGPIMPFDVADPFDLFMISVREATSSGQFIFPKEVLLEKGVISKNNVGGKLAMRIYPSWDTTTNKQAAKAQAWQLEYFSMGLGLQKI